jgi:hypothetical protein
LIGLKNSSLKISPGWRFHAAAVCVFRFTFVPLLVVIYNLHLVSIVVHPLETDAPLVIDANTVLALSITRERFQMVSWRGPQVIEIRYEMNLR